MLGPLLADFLGARNSKERWKTLQSVVNLPENGMPISPVEADAKLAKRASKRRQSVGLGSFSMPNRSGRNSLLGGRRPSIGLATNSTGYLIHG